MDEKSDIDQGLNEIVVPKNKQGSYGSKDYLCNLELSNASLDPMFGVTSHFISSHDGKTDSGNQTKYQYIQEAFSTNIAETEEAWIRCTQDDYMDIYMVPTIHDKNASHPAFMRCKKDDQINSIW